MSKRVSRSITFYPTPEDNELLEELDRRAQAQQISFSELCKLALRQFVQGPVYSVTFTPQEKPLQQRLEAELAALGLSFDAWVKRQLTGPSLVELDHRLRCLEQAVAALQQRPIPLTQAEVEALIQRHLTPPPPPPPPAPDPLIAELGALLGDDF